MFVGNLKTDKKQPFFIPDFSSEVHFEAEIVIRINRLGKHIDERFAHKYYNELTVGMLKVPCRLNGDVKDA